MPILMTKKVDRQALYLNENAYAVYIEAHDKSGGDPWTRWARNFQRCLPITMWQHFGQPLSYETWERDGKVNTDEIVVRSLDSIASPSIIDAKVTTSCTVNPS